MSIGRKKMMRFITVGSDVMSHVTTDAPLVSSACTLPSAAGDLEREPPQTPTRGAPQRSFCMAFVHSTKGQWKAAFMYSSIGRCGENQGLI